MMMENVNQHLDMPEDKTEAGLGDAEENLLWKPQNIQVQKIAPSGYSNDLVVTLSLPSPCCRLTRSRSCGS